MKLLPIDEAYQLPELFSFRRELILATHRRDWAFVADHLRYSAQVWENECGSIEDFVDEYRPMAEDGRLWTILTDVLSLGGTLIRESSWFMAPYVATAFPAAYDPQLYEAVIAAPVALHAEPDDRSSIQGDVSYEIVETFERVEGPEGDRTVTWTRVRTLEGREGWIPRRYHRSSMDYLLTLAPSNHNGRWEIAGLYSETME
jgi:hypothetical protein